MARTRRRNKKKKVFRPRGGPQTATERQRREDALTNHIHGQLCKEDKTSEH